MYVFPVISVLVKASNDCFCVVFVVHFSLTRPGLNWQNKAEAHREGHRITAVYGG